MITLRRLAPGDEAVLTGLALEDEAFEVEGRGRPREPIGAAAAAEYLEDGHVVHWVAEADGAVIGHLLCYLQRRRADQPLQLMLYEIGVDAAHRRQGVGRALVAEMDRWMADNGVTKVWVLADEGDAEAFYKACGFSRDDRQPAQMSRRV